jgi:MFS family permease
MHSPTKIAWFIWIIPASFYALVLTLRIAPGVIMNDMMSHYNIDYTEFGLLSSCFYLGYASMQLPVGMLLTKLNTKYIIAFFMIILIFGILLLTYAPIYQFALFGGLLTGMGSTVGMLGTSNIVNNKFYSSAYSFVIGLTIALGFTIVTCSGKLIGLCLTLFNWQTFYLILVFIITIYIIIVLLFIPNDQHIKHPAHSSHSVISLLITTLTKPKLFITALLGGLLTAPMQGFSDVWGVNYLILNFNLPKSEAILANSFIFLGMAASAPITGYIAEKYQIYKPLIIFYGLLMISMFVILLSHHELNYFIICISLFLTGWGSSFYILIFTVIVHSVEKKLGDIAISIANMTFMIFGFIYHPIIGFIIDYTSNDHSINDAYMYGISVIPLGMIIGILGLSIVTYKSRLE